MQKFMRQQERAVSTAVKVDKKTKEASNHSEGIIHHVTAQSKIKKLP